MAQYLPSLALLACPLGMGLMMFFMMRGNKHDNSQSSPMSAQDTEVARLRAEVDQLRAAQQERSNAPEAGERR